MEAILSRTILINVERKSERHTSKRKVLTIIIFVLCAATPTKHCPAPSHTPFPSDHVFVELHAEKVTTMMAYGGGLDPDSRPPIAGITLR